MRRWIALLLLMALPLQVIASTWPAKPPCPLEAQMATALSAGGWADADLPDCCNDADTFSKTGKACESGQECSTPPIAMPEAVLRCGAHRMGAELSWCLTVPLPPDIVTLPWRPPALG